jgi:hypothetical protein
VADRRRLTQAQAGVAALLGPLDGAEIPGGCETCDAFQTVEPIEAGLWMIRVHHDEWCPTYARLRAHA